MSNLKLAYVFIQLKKKEKENLLWTDLPHCHMSSPETYGPWWSQQSSSHRPTNPPADSELSLKLVCCCQPWQEPKEAPNCPNYQKLRGTESSTEGEHKKTERGEKGVWQQGKRRMSTVKLKAERHNSAWLPTLALPKSWLNLAGDKATCLRNVITSKKVGNSAF